MTNRRTNLLSLKKQKETTEKFLARNGQVSSHIIENPRDSFNQVVFCCYLQ